VREARRSLVVVSVALSLPRADAVFRFSISPNE
jgi:hypothetical protein